MLNYLTSPTCWVLLAGSFLATLILTPLVINLAKKYGIVDGGGYRKINRRVVPLMGGLAIALPFIGLCILGVLHPTSMLSQLVPRIEDLLLLSICSLMIVALGSVDDIMHLSAKTKFVIQGMVALLFCASGKTLHVVDFPLVGTVQFGPIFGTILTVFWLVGVMNAFNLVDGVDGLASSLALVATAGLGTIAAMNGATFIVVLSLGLGGSLVAFLIFNFHPARIFLGDTGSLFLGFVLAALSLMGASRASGAVMLVIPMMVLALPIFDTLTSMGRRILRGHSPFWGDRGHTHHRLLDLGLSQRQVALLMGSVSLLCTIAAVLAQLFSSRQKEFTLAIGLMGVALVGLAWSNGYLKLRHAMRVAQCRSRNNRMTAFAHYAALAFDPSSSRLSIDELFDLLCKELSLDFIEIRDAASGELVFSAECDEVTSMPAGHPDPIEMIKVSDAAHNSLMIRYRLGHSHEPVEAQDEDSRDRDKLEHQDVAACLSRLFSRARLTALMPSEMAESGAGRSDGTLG